MKKNIIIFIETLLIILLILLVVLIWCKGKNNTASLNKKYETLAFNSKFAYYHQNQNGLRTKELLSNVISNIKENKNDNNKLPNIIYLTNNPNIKSIFTDNIQDLNDNDIKDILDVEVFESNDGSFKFNFENINSFKITSNSQNTNIDLIKNLILNIEDEKNYYVAFKNNLNKNALISIIIINEL